MFYQGSRVFYGLATSLSLPLDQFNFLIGQFTAFIIGLLIRRYLRPCPDNILKRHLVELVSGLAISYFCYGLQIVHLIIQNCVSYLVLLTVSRNYSHYLILVISLGHLSSLHFYRLIYDYGNYTIEITGALMITVQKLSSLAFFYHDGIEKSENLTEEQKKTCIRLRPKLIEYFSYMFHFQTILIGPLVFYQDYIDYINGENVLKHDKNQFINGDGYHGNGKIVFDYNYNILPANRPYNSKFIIQQPKIMDVLLKKISIAFVLGLIYYNVTLVFKVDYNLDPSIILKPIWYRILFHYLSVSSQRVKYYLAWQIADIVSNASGLGFNGYDEKNHPKWDLCTSVNILNIETSTSVKQFIDNWNITTQKWLRKIGYERMPTGKTLAVFVLSALWHGFYPGYYLTFISGAILVYAGRGIRQNIRPYFLRNRITFAIYSVITWLGTVLSINYICTSFVLLEFYKSIRFLNSWYWIIHIFAIACIIFLPYKKKFKNYKTIFRLDFLLN